MKTRKLLVSAVAAGALALAGCGKASEPTAPMLPPADLLNSIGVFYKIEKITVVGNEVCVFNDKGKLLVFSEEVKVNADHTVLLFKDSEIPVGEEAIGSDFTELRDGYQCGGQTYPALHILGEGLYLVKDE